MTDNFELGEDEMEPAFKRDLFNVIMYYAKHRRTGEHLCL